MTAMTAITIIGRANSPIESVNSLISCPAKPVVESAKARCYWNFTIHTVISNPQASAMLVAVTRVDSAC